MRRRIEALADRLEEFVSEDGHDALVITCPDEAVGLIAGAVDLNEQRGSLDVSLPFFEPFTDEAAFAERLARHLESFAKEAELSLAVGPGHAGALNRATERLCSFAECIVAMGDVRVVLWLCPASVADTAAYIRTARALVSHFAGRRERVRLAFREVDSLGGLRQALLDAGCRALELCVEEGPAAVRDGLVDDATDASLAPGARTAALFSAAMADVAAGRAEEALVVLVDLARGFEVSGDASSRALCFVLVANALVTLGRIDEARLGLSQGLGLAAEARAIPVVLSGGMLAGRLSMDAGDFSDADTQFDAVARVAAKVGAAAIMAEALVERGRALLSRGQSGAACEAWLCAAEAARRASSPGVESRALLAIVESFGDALEVPAVLRLEERIHALHEVARHCAHEHAS